MLLDVLERPAEQHFFDELSGFRFVLTGQPEMAHFVMDRFAEFAQQTHEAIAAGDARRLGELIDANFDLRRSICRLPEGQVRMIEAARRCGASAKFAGSGGAIIGTYPDDAAYQRLRTELTSLGCRVFRPQVDG